MATKKAVVKSSKRSKGKKTEKWHLRRNEIIQTALTVFAERGYQAAKLEHVAEAMSMQRPSLHYYFGGKDELYDAVLTGIIEDQLHDLQGIEEQSDPAERLQRIATLWLEYIVKSPDAARLMLEQFIDPRAPKTTSTVDPRKRLFEIITGALQEAHDPDQSAADPVLYILLQSALPLVWVCMRDTARERLDYDTLAEASLTRFRSLLQQLLRDYLGGRY